MVTAELLTAAAERLGAPEALVRRSAEARAAQRGTTPDEVLRAWTGEAGPAADTRPAPEAPSQAAAGVEAPPPQQPRRAEPSPAPPLPAPAPPPLRPTPQAAPVLVGRRESPWRLIAGVVGLFVFAAVFAFVVPALDATPATAPPLTLSAEAREGRDVYTVEGCWYCHTQQVRPIVADAGLGPVTRSDRLPSLAPDTLGVQRIGPDLAHAGSRDPTSSLEWVEEFLANPGAAREGSLHPSYGYLSERETHNLALYVWESR